MPAQKIFINIMCYVCHFITILSQFMGIHETLSNSLGFTGNHEDSQNLSNSSCEEWWKS